MPSLWLTCADQRWFPFVGSYHPKVACPPRFWARHTRATVPLDPPIVIWLTVQFVAYSHWFARPRIAHLPLGRSSCGWLAAVACTPSRPLPLWSYHRATVPVSPGRNSASAFVSKNPETSK